MWRERLLVTGLIMTLYAFQASPHPDPAFPSCETGQGGEVDRSLEHGQVLKLAPRQLPSLRYYLYLPRTIRQPARVMISVHGISRNAEEHARLFAPYAEAEGVILMAPRFSRRNFHGYQRLAEAPKEKLRADRVLNTMVADLNTRLGLCPSKLYLFGYSGGGQFVHRYAMLHPDRVERVAIGAAGWYTFPDPDVKYPRGLRTSKQGRLTFDWPGFLKIPMTVLVGEHDTLRDDALNKNRRIDRQQGVNRRQRGSRWIEAMKQAAAQQGFDTEYACVLLPDTSHDFNQAMTNGRMGEAVFGHLFGESSHRRPIPVSDSRLLTDTIQDSSRRNELVQ